MLGHCSSGAAFLAAVSIWGDGSKSIDTNAGLRCVTGPKTRFFCAGVRNPCAKPQTRTRRETPAFALGDVCVPVSEASRALPSMRLEVTS